MTESAKEWFNRFPDLGREPVFTLRVRFHGYFAGNRIIIRAYEGPVAPSGHTTLFCDLRQKSVDGGTVSYKELFAREAFYCGVPAGKTIDGDYAKELVLSLFATLDQDNEAFDTYTTEQQDFVQRFGDELKMIAADRYGEP